MRRTVLAVVFASMIVLAGCSALPGGSDDARETPVGDEPVAVADDDPGATGVNQTVRITVDGTTNGTEWTGIGASYPRDRFGVDSAKHGEILLGVDTDGDGRLDRRFDESHVSGVNNNEYSFDITLDTGYTLRDGDVVVVGYPAVDNPEKPGEYEVEIRLNGEQSTTGPVTIE